MAAVQLNFTLRTSSKCKTVHLVGSWDNYKSNLPLNKDSSKSGGWKGTFRFSSPTLVPGGRYWYYYIIDGYHVSHDPARESTVEPTTGRKLNILDIPNGNRTAATTHGSHGYSTQTMAPSSKRGSHGSAAIKGRALSPSRIQHPHPSRPYETQVFRNEQFSSREMEALSKRYAAQRLTDTGSSTSESDSDGSSDIPSLSSRSSQSSSPSSVSSVGTPLSPGSGLGSPGVPLAAYNYGTAGGMGLGIRGAGCTCERYAVMKDGRRFRVDCGGKVCGGDSASGCSESSDESSSEDERRRKRSSRKSKGHSSSSSSSKHKKSGGLRIRR